MLYLYHSMVLNSHILECHVSSGNGGNSIIKASRLDIGAHAYCYIYAQCFWYMITCKCINTYHACMLGHKWDDQSLIVTHDAITSRNLKCRIFGLNVGKLTSWVDKSIIIAWHNQTMPDTIFNVLERSYNGPLGQWWSAAGGGSSQYINMPS